MQEVDWRLLPRTKALRGERQWVPLAVWQICRQVGCCCCCCSAQAWEPQQLQ